MCAAASSPMGFESEKTAALEAVAEASKAVALLRRKNEFTEALDKDDGSPVTLADYFVQAVINQRLAETFPRIPIVAEENSDGLESDSGKTLLNRLGKLLPGQTADAITRTINRGNHEGGNRGRFWTLDPIDGTKGFLAKRQYSVALALIEDGEVVVGVLGCPELGSGTDGNGGDKGFAFFAERGRGAWQMPLYGGRAERVRVSRIEDPSEAVMCESAEPSHSSRESSEIIAKLLDIKTEPVRMDSQCKYAVLARGDASVYLRLPSKNSYEEKIWDHAAGAVIVAEAGGRVTDSLGNPLDFSLGKTLRKNRGVLGTNALIHRKVLDAIKETFSL